MNATTVGFLLIILGGVLTLLQKYMSATKKHDFKWSIFWRDNLPMAIFNVIFGVAALFAIYYYNADFRKAVDGIDYVGFVWIAVGFAGHYFWQLIFGALKFAFKGFLKKFKK